MGDEAGGLMASRDFWSSTVGISSVCFADMISRKVDGPQCEAFQIYCLILPFISTSELVSTASYLMVKGHHKIIFGYRKKN